MPKKILIVNTNKKSSKSLSGIFSELKNSELSFCFFGETNKLRNLFKENKWPNSNLKNILQKNKFFLTNFILFPLAISQKINFFLKVFLLKIKNKDIAVIFIDIKDKIFFSAICNFLKIDIIWFEFNVVDYQDLSKFSRKKYLRLSRQARILTLTNHIKERLLALGVEDSRITKIQIGTKQNQKKYQENIFSKIAQNDHKKIGKKFFTIGTIINLDEKQKIEILYHSILKIKDFIPRLQLIIVGEGKFSPENNPWAKWLAKKMEIETMIWFINSTENTRKWLDSFDIFVLSSNKFDIDEYSHALSSMTGPLPLLVPENIGFEDIIHTNNNGIIHKGNSDDISGSIIEIFKNKHLRENLKRNAHETHEEKLSMNIANKKISDFIKNYEDNN